MRTRNRLAVACVATFTLIAPTGALAQSRTADVGPLRDVTKNRYHSFKLNGACKDLA